ncbi:hypothetical protein WDW89_18140 [Deltaproteobacteria bacterium TL4]
MFHQWLCSHSFWGILLQKIVFIKQIFIAALLVFFLVSGCTSGSPKAYYYPTDEALKVQETCTLIYAPQYAGILEGHRQIRVNKITIISEGILAQFSSGREFVMPIQTALPLGNEYYCGNWHGHYPCLSENDWDSNCARTYPVPPNRFKY